MYDIIVLLVGGPVGRCRPLDVALRWDDIQETEQDLGCLTVGLQIRRVPKGFHFHFWQIAGAQDGRRRRPTSCAKEM